MAAMRRRGVTGSPKTVRAGIEDHAARYGVEEIMLVTISFDFAKRKRSYELIAEEFCPLGHVFRTASFWLTHGVMSEPEARGRKNA